MRKYLFHLWSLFPSSISLSKLIFITIFRYVKTNSQKKTESETNKIKKYYMQRNNLFLKILMLIKKDSRMNKEFYHRQVDSFIKVNSENLVEINIDVDFFFLSLLGYHHKAKKFLIKHNEYFKNLVKDYKDVDPITYFDG